MLKTIMLRKKYQTLQKEEAELRAKQAGFAKREEDLAAQVEGARVVGCQEFGEIIGACL